MLPVSASSNMGCEACLGRAVSPLHYGFVGSSFPAGSSGFSCQAGPRHPLATGNFFLKQSSPRVFGSTFQISDSPFYTSIELQIHSHILLLLIIIVVDLDK
jgi:hypothetical protein